MAGRQSRWKNGALFVAALAGLAQPVPAREPAPTAAAASAPQRTPRPAIWLVEDEDTKIYLFGTIHILPPGFKWRSAALDRVVESASELVVETYDAPGEDALDQAVELFFAEQPSPILERVPADKRASLAAIIEQGLLPAEAYDMMQTWAAAIMLGLSQLLGEYGVDDPDAAPGVEDMLEESFRSAGKPIGSVEDPLTVLGGMNALPPAVQTELLVHAVEEVGTTDRRPDQIHVAWAAGKAEQMQVGETEDLPPAVYDILIRQRNAAWTRWLVQRMERPGTVLFAVGAGHLAGPDSVQRMLAERGLTARRVD